MKIFWMKSGKFLFHGVYYWILGMSRKNRIAFAMVGKVYFTAVHSNEKISRNGKKQREMVSKSRDMKFSVLFRWLEKKMRIVLVI